MQFDIIKNKKEKILIINDLLGQPVARFSPFSFEIFSDRKLLLFRNANKRVNNPDKLVPFGKNVFTRFCEQLLKIHEIRINPNVFEFEKEFELVHRFNSNKDLITEYGDYLYNHGSGYDSTDDAAFGYSDGTTKNNLVYDVYSFVGCTFHLIQQTGGNLFYNGIKISAFSMDDTSGVSLNPNTRVLVCTKLIMTIDELEKHKHIRD
jgi:hypothetical protein